MADMPQELTDGILRYLTDAPTSEFRQANLTVLDQWQGDENLLWRVRAQGIDPHAGYMEVESAVHAANAVTRGAEVDAVVKFYLDTGQARSRRQFDGMQLAAPLGLAPAPLWVDRIPEGLARPVLIYHWAEGDALDPADPSTLDALAASVATLHRADVQALRRFSPRPVNLDFYWRLERGSIQRTRAWLPEHLAIAAAFGQLADTATQLVETALPHFGQTPPAPVHGDLRLDHALLHRGQAMLLDWEMFGIGDPALDCARFLHFETQSLTTAQQDAWRDAYLMQSDEPAMGLRLGLYERLLAFSAVTYLLVGLEENVRDTSPEEWNEAEPFLQQTLAAAWGMAAVKLGISLDVDPDSLIAPFFAWLKSFTDPDAA